MFHLWGPHPDSSYDAAALERLLNGGTIADLPDEYLAIGRVLAAAAAPARPDELTDETAAAASFVAARDVMALREPSERGRRSVLTSLMAVLAIAASTGGIVAAARGNLPDPVQEVAHETLGTVGISVPSITTQTDGTPNPADPIDDTEATPTPPPAGSGAPSFAAVGGTGSVVTPGVGVAGAAAPGTDPDADPVYAPLPSTFPDTLPEVPSDVGPGKEKKPPPPPPPPKGDGSKRVDPRRVDPKTVDPKA